MKIRNCNLSRLPTHFFMGLSIKHLYIIRSRLSTMEVTSLNPLEGSLETIDFSSNNINTVSGFQLKEHRLGLGT